MGYRIPSFFLEAVLEISYEFTQHGTPAPPLVVECRELDGLGPFLFRISAAGSPPFTPSRVQGCCRRGTERPLANRPRTAGRCHT